MKKKGYQQFRCILAACFYLLLNSSSYTQEVKYDYNWVLGYGWRTPENDTITPKDGMVLDFNEDPMRVRNIKMKFRMGFTATSISDSMGNLAFYTNGCYIGNSEFEIIENGDSLNYGDIYDYVCFDQGYVVSQGVLAIPLKDNQKYILFHIKFYFSNFERLEVDIKGLYYSVVERIEGRYVVSQNNVPLLERDTVIYTGCTAVRHANGRDWWVIAPLQKSDEFVLFLVNEYGIQSSKRIRSGIVNSGYTGLIQHKFSPDGKYYAFIDRKDNGLMLMGFDRCAGDFTKVIHLPRPTEPPINQVTGVEFSPSGKYLYAHFHTELFQYDLEASEIENSKEIVGVYDGVNHKWHVITFMQLAPDGRIYTSVGNGVENLNLIKEPDQKGLDCDFRFQGIKTDHTNWFSLNNVPNYRLGPEEGTICDSLQLKQGAVAHWRSDTIANDRRGRRFTDLSYFNPQDWSWDFGDGSQSKLIHPEHQFPDTGVYKVCLRVSNRYGTHSECRNIRISDVINGQDDPEWNLRKEMYLFPNPAQEEVMIQFDRPLEDEAKYSLLNLESRVVRSGSLPRACFNKVLDLEDIPSGIYILRVRLKTGREMGMKLLVTGK